MLIANADLVARIEAAERRLLEDGVRAGKARRDLPDAFCTTLSGGAAGFVEAGSPLNKVSGLGIDGPLDENDLASVEESYAARNCPVQIELATHADPAVGEMLTMRGYRLIGYEDILGRSLDQTPDVKLPDGLRMEPCDGDDLLRWLDVVVQGFAHPDTEGLPAHESFPTDVLERIIGDLATMQGMSRLLALRDGARAGGASMRVSEGVAQLCGAATLPEHRRRGVQTALLHTRLAQAREAGCDIAVVTTQPGSKSQHNVRKQGFELLYSRAILVKQPKG